MSRLVQRAAAWRPLLRIARRDALRARGRSALVVAMVALPILAMTATDVLTRSAQLEPDEEVARRLGQAQASVEAWGSDPVVQAPDPRQGSSWVAVGGDSGDQTGGTAYRSSEDLAAVVPAGYRVLTSESGAVVTVTRDGLTAAEWTEAPVGDPALAGRYVVREGAAASGPDEVAVTSELFGRLGVELGGTVRLEKPVRELTLTGIVDQVGRPSQSTLWAAPGALLGDEVATTSTPTLWLAGDEPVTWADVMALNESGLLVTSRDVLLDPPPASEVPYLSSDHGGGVGNGNDFWFVVIMLVLVVVLAGLEVCLLAGAAFAVGARRQARSLGLLAAAGASRRHVRSVVLAGGLVLGVAGAVVGVLLGLLLAAVARPVLTRVADADFGHFDVRPLELLAIALVGVATGVLAAVLPARTAARQDPVAALTGRRGQVRTARRVPVIGVVTVVVGVGAAALGSALAVAHSTGLNPLNGGSTALVAGLIAGGAALTQIGLIITSPAIIGLAGRWSGRLPLAGRLALRDAARHRGRSAPAMAAVLTAVTGSTALVLYVASLDAHDRASYMPTWPSMSAGVELTTFEYDTATGRETRTTADPDRVLTAITPELPSFEAHVITVLDTSCDSSGGDCAPGYAQPVIPPENECFLWSVDGDPSEGQRSRAERDPRCQDSGLVVNGSFNGTPVGGADVLETVARRAVPTAASNTLAAGGVVVFQPSLVTDEGTVLIDVIPTEEATAAMREERAPQARQVELPATYLRTTEAAAEAVYSPGAAEALGLRTTPSTLFLRFETLPTQAEEEAAYQALSDAGLEAYLSVERGYVSNYGLGLLALVVGAGVVTLGAAGIATGLAQADARADHATLAAVGAAPRLRRRLAAAQALSISVLGTALGVAAGFVPAVALIGALPGIELTVPYWQLAQILVAIPAIAAGSAWLLTRSRVPMERRVA